LETGDVSNAAATQGSSMQPSSQRPRLAEEIPNHNHKTSPYNLILRGFSFLLQVNCKHLPGLAIDELFEA
jgi:hypothetical protein